VVLIYAFDASQLVLRPRAQPEDRIEVLLSAGAEKSLVVAEKWGGFTPQSFFFWKKMMINQWGFRGIGFSNPDVSVAENCCPPICWRIKSILDA